MRMAGEGRRRRRGGGEERREEGREGGMRKERYLLQSIPRSGYACAIAFK